MIAHVIAIIRLREKIRCAFDTARLLTISPYCWNIDPLDNNDTMSIKTVPSDLSFYLRGKRNWIFTSAFIPQLPFLSWISYRDLFLIRRRVATALENRKSERERGGRRNCFINRRVNDDRFLAHAFFKTHFCYLPTGPRAFRWARESNNHFVRVWEIGDKPAAIGLRRKRISASLDGEP